MSASVTDDGLLTPERKQILIASAVLVFISLGVLIPRLGLTFGWFSPSPATSAAG